MKTIPLTKGQFAIVDDEDYESLSKINWCALESKWGYYAVRALRNAKRTITVSMHRQIMNACTGVKIDHRNRNGLDNRRSNLRRATISQNNANQKLSRCNTSGFKGVCWHKAAKKWKAAIYVQNKSIYIGVFENIKTAAAAYDVVAVKHFGEFACTNKMLGLIP